MSEAIRAAQGTGEEATIIMRVRFSLCSRAGFLGLWLWCGFWRRRLLRLGCNRFMLAFSRFSLWRGGKLLQRCIMRWGRECFLPLRIESWPSEVVHSISNPRQRHQVVQHLWDGLFPVVVLLYKLMWYYVNKPVQIRDDKQLC